jgi:hypothetical protein
VDEKTKREFTANIDAAKQKAIANPGKKVKWCAGEYFFALPDSTLFIISHCTPSEGFAVDE